MGPGLRSSVRNAGFLIGANSIAAIIRIVYVMALARGLGPEGFGALAAAQSLYLVFVTAATAGTAAYLSREFSVGGVRAHRALPFSFLAELGFLLAGAAAFAVATRLGDALLILLFALVVPARGLAEWAHQCFAAREAGHVSLKRVLWFRGGELVATALVLAAGQGLAAVVAVHAISWVAESLVSISGLRRTSPLLPKGESPGALLRRVPSLAGTSAAFASSDWLRASPVIILSFLGILPEMLGRFALSWNSAQILAITIMIAIRAAFPLASRAHARADGKDLYFLDFSIRASLLIGAACAIGGIAFGDWAIRLLGGRDFDGSGAVFASALVSVGPFAMNYALDQRLFLDGRSAAVLIGNLAAFALLAAIFALSLGTGFMPLHAALWVAAVLVALAAAKLALVAPGRRAGFATSALRAAAAGMVGMGAALAAHSFGDFPAAIAGTLALAGVSLLFGAITRAERRAALALLRR